MEGPRSWDKQLTTISDGVPPTEGHLSVWLRTTLQFWPLIGERVSQENIYFGRKSARLRVVLMYVLKIGMILLFFSNNISSNIPEKLKFE